MGLVRDFIWGMAEFALSVMDSAYSIIYNLATMKIFEFTFISQWYYTLCGLIVFFVIIRLFAMYFADLVKEDTPMQIKLTPIEVLIRIAVIALVIALTPTFFSYFTDIGVSFIENIDLVTSQASTMDDFKPSQIILENMLPESDITIDTFEINRKVSGEYIITLTTIFWIIALAAGGAVAMMMIGLQITQRFIGLAYKFIISPFPISGLVNHQSQSFKQWLTLCMSDVMANGGQFLFLMFVLAINSSATLNTMLTSEIAKVVFFVGSCLAVLNAPSGIAQLFGNDFGTASALQSLNSAKMLGGMVKGGLGVAGAGAAHLAGAALTGGAGAFSLGAAVKSGGISGVASSMMNSFKNAGSSAGSASAGGGAGGASSSPSSSPGSQSGGGSGTAGSVGSSGNPSIGNSGFLQGNGNQPSNSGHSGLVDRWGLPFSSQSSNGGVKPSKSKAPAMQPSLKNFASYAGSELASVSKRRWANSAPAKATNTIAGGVSKFSNGYKNYLDQGRR